jgi:hypothetical protein
VCATWRCEQERPWRYPPGCPLSSAKVLSLNHFLLLTMHAQSPHGLVLQIAHASSEVELTGGLSHLFVVRQARAMVAQVVAALQCAGEGDDPMLVLEALGPNLGLDDKYRRRLPRGARGMGSPSGPHVVPGILGTSRAAGKVNWAEAAAAAQVGGLQTAEEVNKVAQGLK